MSIWGGQGLWDVLGVSVRYISHSWVQFSIEHKVINGERAIKNVHHTWLDRMRGIDFDTKARNELVKFKQKYLDKNIEILELREKREKLLR